MRVPIARLDEGGVVRDLTDINLPPNFWTSVNNVKFQDGKILKVKGNQLVFDPPSIAPHWLLHCFEPVAGESVWVYAGLTKVYTFFAGAHSNITRQSVGVDVDYTGSASQLWNGGVLGGIPILNNGGADVPQFWAPISSSQRLQNLTSWNVAWRARVIRPFKNFLVALDMTESGTRFPHRLRWSHPAAPGALPSTWDETDATKDAGLIEFSDANAGPVVDCLQMRDVNMVYKRRSTWGMQFTGGVQKFRFFNIFEDSGILADHCVCGTPEGDKHFVMTGEDLVVHNGLQRNSVLQNLDRRWLLANMDAQNYDRSFCVANTAENESWFCFPQHGAQWPNTALIWNQESGAVTFQDLNNASFIRGGVIASGGSTWDSDVEPWDGDATQWDELAGSAFAQRLLQADPVASKLRHLETTEQFGGVDFLAFVERTGLSVLGADRNGAPISDPTRFKLIRGLWIRGSGAPLDVRIGTQDKVDGPLTWSAPQTFVPGTADKLDFTLPCRLWAIRFSVTSNQPSRIDGYDVDVEPLGDF